MLANLKSANMSCLPFCINKTRVGSACSIKASEGRLHLHNNIDSGASHASKQVSQNTQRAPQNTEHVSKNLQRGIGPVCGNFTDQDTEYVISSYESLDAELADEESHMIREILSSEESDRSLQRNTEPLRNCHSETNISNKNIQTGTPAFDTSTNREEKGKNNKNCLRTLGRQVEISRSLHEYVKQARKQQLPPLKKKFNWKMRNKTEARQLDSNFNVTGEESILSRCLSKASSSQMKAVRRETDAGNKGIVSVDYTTDQAMQQQHSYAKELDQEDWDLVQDLLQMKTSDTQSCSEGIQATVCLSKSDRPGVPGGNENKNDTRATSKRKEAETAESGRKDRVDNPPNHMMYNDEELAMMDLIEEEYAKANAR